MIVKETNLEGLLIIEPKIFGDSRGYFFEAYNNEKYNKVGITATFVQDNQSLSEEGILRGLHFQKEPYAQGKLVRVLTGRALDVVVDLRPGSKTFGRHYKYMLEAEKNNMMYIPEGFAHGFLTLEKTLFFYKCTNYYNKNAESGVLWNDPELNIDWGINNPVLSEKDLKLPLLKEVVNTL